METLSVEPEGKKQYESVYVEEEGRRKQRQKNSRRCVLDLRIDYDKYDKYYIIKDSSEPMIVSKKKKN